MTRFRVMSHIVGTVMPSHTEEIPKSVKIFRSIISKFKKRIFNELDSSDIEGDKNTQNVNKLQDAINYIINFGHILMSILKTKKNTSDDVINLFNDSYAVGDFVIIANDEGLVEDLNLFVTRLRSSNGDLITIPNGSVGIVRNQTKDWSRVDYSIQISYDADIQQALGILRQVAEELYHDSQWHSLISEPPDLKGVEDLSHLGVRLRVWLKTKPGEQWIVARELRLRLKSAFEAAGISIGIPQQAFLFQNSGDRLSGE